MGSEKVIHEVLECGWDICKAEVRHVFERMSKECHSYVPEFDGIHLEDLV